MNALVVVVDFSSNQLNTNQSYFFPFIIRSMGILLPPVSQVTNTRINLTQHHRNRSLDSALQRIPEVEVSSPNAESDNKLCTNICSKIGASSTSSTSSNSSSSSSSSTNPNNTPNIITNGKYQLSMNWHCNKTK